MEKKIIGFKLIKLYPGKLDLGEEINFTNTPQEQILKYTHYLDYPEFWQPIYEEIGVDLDRIYTLIRNTPTTYNGKLEILSAMKEACKQTLELVLKKLQEHTHVGIKELREKILNLIK